MTRFMVASVAEKVPDKGSWFIMLSTGYTASHLILVRLSTGQVYHANGKLVTTDCTLEDLLQNHAIIDSVTFTAPCTEAQFDEWWAPLNGRPYSEKQFGGFLFVWTKWFIRLFKDGRRGAICTEFVCWFMEDIMKRPEFKDLEFTKPLYTMNLIKKAVT